MEEQLIADLIKKYQGIPYVFRGRDLNGLDCLGLAALFYKDCGIDIPENDGAAYERNWFRKDPERYLRGIQSFGREVAPENIQPLDFVYFRMGGGIIAHGGIMVDPENFIHVLERTRVHLSPLNFKWRRRLVGIRRFR